MDLRTIKKNIIERRYELLVGALFGFISTILLVVFKVPFNLVTGQQYSSYIDSLVSGFQGTIELPIFKVGIILMALGMLLSYFFYAKVRLARQNLVKNKLYLGIFIATVLGLFYYAFVVAPIQIFALPSTKLTSLLGNLSLGVGRGFGLFSFLGLIFTGLFAIPGVGIYLAIGLIIIFLIFVGVAGWQILTFLTLIQKNFTLVLIVGGLILLVWLLSGRRKR